MSAVATPPPKPRAAFRPRPLIWTVAEFHRVNGSGIWEGRRPILLRGVILEQGPMDPPHATGVALVTAALTTAFPGWYLRGQLPLVFGLHTDPIPDVAVVAGTVRDYATGHPTTAAVVVEVSDTTLATDLTDKVELYAEAGIADYWVIDVAGKRLLVFRDPYAHPAGGFSYRTHQTLTAGDTVTPLAAPHASVPVADLLP
jgi:Uma2 family endonuclease